MKDALLKLAIVGAWVVTYYVVGFEVTVVGLLAWIRLEI